MTQLLERPVTPKTTAPAIIGTPRGGTYVTLPGHVANPDPTEAGYISLPGSGTRIGNRAQGSYVTLHSAPLGETKVSYTRRS